MNIALLLQQIVVAACVLGAAVYALRRVWPQLGRRLQRAATRLCLSLGQPQLAQRLRPAAIVAGAGCGSGCGSCGSCGSAPASGKPKPPEQAIRFQR